MQRHADRLALLGALPSHQRERVSLLEAAVVTELGLRRTTYCTVAVAADALYLLPLATVESPFHGSRHELVQRIPWGHVARVERQHVAPDDTVSVFLERRVGAQRIALSVWSDGRRCVPEVLVWLWLYSGHSQLDSAIRRAQHTHAVRALVGLHVKRQLAARICADDDEHDVLPAKAETDVARCLQALHELRADEAGAAVALVGISQRGSFAAAGSRDEARRAFARLHVDARSGRVDLLAAGIHKHDRAGRRVDAEAVSAEAVLTAAAGLRGAARSVEDLATSLLLSRIHRRSFLLSALPHKLGSVACNVLTASRLTAEQLGDTVVRSRRLHTVHALPLLGLQVARLALVRASLSCLQSGCFDIDGLVGATQIIAAGAFDRLVQAAATDAVPFFSSSLYEVAPGELTSEYGSLSVRDVQALGLPLPEAFGEGALPSPLDMTVTTRLVRSAAFRRTYVAPSQSLLGREAQLRDQRASASGATLASPLPFAYTQVDSGAIDIAQAVREAAEAHSLRCRDAAEAAAARQVPRFFARPSSPILTGACAALETGPLDVVVPLRGQARLVFDIIDQRPLFKPADADGNSASSGEPDADVRECLERLAADSARETLPQSDAMARLTEEGLNLALDLRDVGAALLVALIPVVEAAAHSTPAAVAAVAAAASAAHWRGGGVGRSSHHNADDGLGLGQTVKREPRTAAVLIANLRVAEHMELRATAREHIALLEDARRRKLGASLPGGSEEEDEATHEHEEILHDGKAGGDSVCVGDALLAMGLSAACSYIGKLADRLRDMLELASTARRERATNDAYRDEQACDGLTEASATVRYRDPRFAVRLLLLSLLLHHVVTNAPALRRACAPLLRRTLGKAVQGHALHGDEGALAEAARLLGEVCAAVSSRDLH